MLMPLPKKIYGHGWLLLDGGKMSKSKGNVVDPNDVVDVFGADVLRTYVLFMGDYGSAAPWNESSMKGCKRFLERIADLTPYRVTEKLMALAGDQCRFMHCLPSFHDLETEVGREIYEKFGLNCMEAEDAVFEGKQSIVFDEAENRMHTIKAVMVATLGD